MADMVDVIGSVRVLNVMVDVLVLTIGSIQPRCMMSEAIAFLGKRAIEYLANRGSSQMKPEHSGIPEAK